MICKSVVAPGKLPLTFTPDIDTPPELERATPERRKEFWRSAARIAMEVKQRELSQGLDYAGRKLRPVKPRKLKYQSGHRLDGDPLMPHRAMSRTRRLLRTLTMGVKVTFYWARGWGKIVDYHRRGAAIMRGGKCVGRLPVRNVFGISQKGRDEISRRAAEAWRAGKPAEKPVHQIMSPTGLSVQLPMDPVLKPEPGKQPTMDQWLAMGVKVTKSKAKVRDVNADTGISGFASPGVRLQLDWGRRKR
ncbi:hypothetical protein UFOVP184_2 [uncultured Caudovirales phage]|uniref:Uncharacterized protein n=1 Tax=uncultured Caudovirales phage TaxID=2100421 RepID=A0A6J7WCN1_9CAUD|nr:hypothetical protein UFOVP184_2 [uncultured Caudovirales phage]